MTNGLALLDYWLVHQKLNHVSSVSLHSSVPTLRQLTLFRYLRRPPIFHCIF